MNVVSDIVPGQVNRYGEIARTAGFPRHARRVSESVCRSPDSLPRHRVVCSDRTLAFERGSVLHNEQKALLLEEGVKWRDEKVVLLDDKIDRDRMI